MIKYISYLLVVVLILGGCAQAAWHLFDRPSDGADGVAGADGSDAGQSTNGTDGSNGSNGTSGSDGADGLDGTSFAEDCSAYAEGKFFYIECEHGYVRLTLKKYKFDDDDSSSDDRKGHK